VPVLEVEPRERPKLRALIEGSRPGDQAAYVVRCACASSPGGTTGETVVDHVRLFPLRPEVRWTYRVHEQILPSLKRAKVPVQWTDLTIRHMGYVDPALRARKLDRDARILKRELEERPDEPFVLFNLGSIAVERRQWAEALAFLTHSLAGSAPSDSIVRKLYALTARVHQMMGNLEEALRTCTDGLKLDPDDAELWFRKGVVHRHRGESSEAERCWRLILNLKRPDQFCSFDQGIYGHLTRRNLAALAAERGDQAEVERLWNDVLAECPRDREALAKLHRLNGTNPAPPGK
jgi:tetratricopeptide (TPR) repeat protein